MIAGFLALYLGLITQTPGSNINMTQCTVDDRFEGMTFTFIDALGIPHQADPAVQAIVTISYSNTADEPATAIDFGMVSKGDLAAVVRDSGSFAANVPVTHKFAIMRQISANLTPAIPLAEAACAVLKVTYKSGKVWRNPNPPL